MSAGDEGVEADRQSAKALKRELRSRRLAEEAAMAATAEGAEVVLARRERQDQRIAIKEQSRGRSAPQSLFVYSFPKAGRTWLSHLWFYYSVALVGRISPPPTEFLDPRAPLDSPWYHGEIVPRLAERGLPLLRFTHRAVPGDRDGDIERKLGARLQSSRYGLIVRRPERIMESYFHHAQGRYKDRMALKARAVLTVSAFVRDADYGVDRLIDYYRVFDRRRSERQVEIAYEDMLADAGAALTALLCHAGHPSVADEAVAVAVEAASFERMQARERDAYLRQRGVEPGRNAYRARVGGDGASSLVAEDRAYIASRVAAAGLGLLERYASEQTAKGS